jgi:putative DNA primase/helicase
MVNQGARASAPADYPGSTWAALEDGTEAVQWAWPGWLPSGFLTVLASEPGAGKSSLCLRLVACYTAGLPWPDGSPFTAQPGRVLWCEGEAGRQDIGLIVLDRPARG